MKRGLLGVPRTAGKEPLKMNQNAKASLYVAGCSLDDWIVRPAMILRAEQWASWRRKNRLVLPWGLRDVQLAN